MLHVKDNGRFFLVAKLHYKYEFPSIRPYVRPYVCLSIRFRGKRDFLGP